LINAGGNKINKVSGKNWLRKNRSFYPKALKQGSDCSTVGSIPTSLARPASEKMASLIHKWTSFSVKYSKHVRYLKIINGNDIGFSLT